MADPIEPNSSLDQAWAIALIEEPEADSSGTDFGKVFAGDSQRCAESPH